MKQAQFLSPFLLESPLIFAILEKIREKHDIDSLDPSKDVYKQRIRKDMERDVSIDDWQAVRQVMPYLPLRATLPKCLLSRL